MSSNKAQPSEARAGEGRGGEGGNPRKWIWSSWQGLITGKIYYSAVDEQGDLWIAYEL